jgi:ATP phosphoribosyltransferase regulatory subunit
MASAATRSAETARDKRAEALVASFERAGYTRVAPAILQPAEPFLDLSGEDIRKRMFLTSDPHGRELCLRPDLTIPVSRDYLASPTAGKAHGFCYLGQVFRHRQNESGEFLQAGIESFGRPDIAAADAEMLALGLDTTAHYGLATPDIRIGDVGLFAALIAALDLAPAWKRRLIKDFNHKTSLAQDLERLTISATHARPEYQGVLAALAGSDPKGAHALVTDLLSIAGISPRETRALIERFLAVAGDPDEAAAELRTIAKDGSLKLNAALDLFESRTGFLAARGVDVRRIKFSTAFGRGLDYYTGFVFELHDPQGRAGQLVAGGRYDGLLTRLGSTKPIPAVGFAAWIERLAARGGAA